jgi:hypothetical protein
MEYTYQLAPLSYGQTEPMYVVRSDRTVIPFAPDNTDYQAYLKWVAEGNTPLPAENE